ncbi:MAG: T9SS type A sorting domain-containing protein, partial [Bacteroidales bacterium]|nr:T9SS type A sorting domain-containing protein [Bacteroidales bacterium]
SNKLVEVGGFNTSNGGNIQQWEDAGQQTGHWQFFAAAKSTSSELTQKENYIIYPDPAANEIFIKGITSAATVEVFNTQGSLVLVKTDINESQSVNIEDLKQGLYVVLIKMESGEIQHLKFVKE